MDNITLLIDTNVWLDFYGLERPAGKEAEVLMSFALNHDCKLLYPGSIMGDLFYSLVVDYKRKCREQLGLAPEKASALAKEVAWNSVEHMRENAFAISSGQTDVWLACKWRSIHNDLEDNLVLAAAQRAKATYLVTNDEKLLKHAPVAALSAKDALRVLKTLVA